MKARKRLSRDDTIAALRALAARKIVVTRKWLEANDRALLRAVLLHFQKVAMARHAADVAGPNRFRWTEARVVAELRRLHARGNRITEASLIDLGRQDLRSAIRPHVGTIERARRLAGIPEPKRARWKGRRERWDGERVISEILDRVDRRKSIAFSKVPSKLAHAGARFFESWRGAVEAAGFDYDEIRLKAPPSTKTSLIALLRSLARDTPSMQWTELVLHGASKAIVKRFGTLEAALALLCQVG